jgi:hypothetical protein
MGGRLDHHASSFIASFLLGASSLFPHGSGRVRMCARFTNGRRVVKGWKVRFQDYHVYLSRQQSQSFDHLSAFSFDAVTVQDRDWIDGFLNQEACVRIQGRCFARYNEDEASGNASKPVKKKKASKHLQLRSLKYLLKEFRVRQLKFFFSRVPSGGD